MSFTSDSMTPESCVNFCDQHRYVYAGLEYSRVRLHYYRLSDLTRISRSVVSCKSQPVKRRSNSLPQTVTMPCKMVLRQRPTVICFVVEILQRSVVQATSSRRTRAPSRVQQHFRRITVTHTRDAIQTLLDPDLSPWPWDILGPWRHKSASTPALLKVTRTLGSNGLKSAVRISHDALGISNSACSLWQHQHGHVG